MSGRLSDWAVQKSQISSCQHRVDPSRVPLPLAPVSTLPMHTRSVHNLGGRNEICHGFPAASRQRLSTSRGRDLSGVKICPAAPPRANLVPQLMAQRTRAVSSDNLALVYCGHCGEHCVPVLASVSLSVSNSGTTSRSGPAAPALPHCCFAHWAESVRVRGNADEKRRQERLLQPALLL